MERENRFLRRYPAINSRRRHRDDVMAQSTHVFWPVLCIWSDHEYYGFGVCIPIIAFNSKE